MEAVNTEETPAVAEDEKKPEDEPQPEAEKVKEGAENEEEQKEAEEDKVYFSGVFHHLIDLHCVVIVVLYGVYILHW